MVIPIFSAKRILFFHCMARGSYTRIHLLNLQLFPDYATIKIHG